MTPNRRDLLQIAGMFGAFPLMAAEGTPASLIDSIVDAQQAKLNPHPWGEHRLYFQGTTANGRTASAGSVWVKPGMEPHPPHQHPEDEFQVIVEGTGEMLLDGKLTKAGPGTMMYCAGGKVHGVHNTGDTPMVIYYCQWQA
jgi:quercetin dioxygenase-like cupin family protein